MKVIVNTTICGILAGMLFLTSCGENSVSNNLPSQLSLIESYVTTSIKDTNVSRVGNLWYHKIEKGTGAKIKEGSTVTLSYTLFMVSTSTYLIPYATNLKKDAIIYDMDTTYADKFYPITVTVGSSGLFDGFDKGLTYLNEGDVALILFPSTMGYGDQAMGVVPANTPLAVQVYVYDPNSKKEVQN